MPSLHGAYVDFGLVGILAKKINSKAPSGAFFIILPLQNSIFQ
jgi:hypothetical protein